MRRDRHWRQNLCALFLGIVTLSAFLAPWLAPHPFDEQNIEARLQTPNLQFWMGSDLLGRDLLSRVLFGGRISLWIGVSTALLALVVGGFTGAWAGWKRGLWDSILMRIVDFFFIFPSLLLAILLLSIFGRGLTGLALALTLTSWVTVARLVRAQVIQARGLPYVEAALALGASDSRVVFRHILPNLWGPILVTLTFLIPSNILAESFLSFIGLGVQPPYASWGTLASDGFRALRSYPHLLLFPGGILFFTLLTFNYLGEEVQTLLDPARKAVRAD